ncbi:MAG: hypothetical protein K2R98_12340 [Gemmataceae bacterium]|nr:hypothetical protein [Gemmataceae bacterium]
METIKTQATIAADGTLRLEVPSRLPPGLANVVLVVELNRIEPQRLPWESIVGVGKEIWAGEDAQDYVNHLRDEWER